MSKHTLGPWTVEGLRVLEGNLIIASVARDDGIEDYREQRADGERKARLIAAAPEMLGALWDLVRVAQAEPRLVGNAAITQALAAISKAQGADHAEA